MLKKALRVCMLSAVIMLFATVSYAGMLTGLLLDPNWYAPHPIKANVYGTGWYECGVSGSVLNSSALSLASGTDIYGAFSKLSAVAGTYAIASWDNYWRSEFSFNNTLVRTASVNLRMHANMWSYGPSYGYAGNEFGQMFAASGSSVVMVVIRSALKDVDVTVSIHDGGPNGPQIGPSRSATLGDGPSETRFIWNGGEVSTIPGHLYYLKLKAPTGKNIVLCYNSPIPDMSDAMPEGGMYINGVASSDPALDMGITICSDDDGILTNMYIRDGGYNMMGAMSVGETFLARGVNLLSFCAWLPDTSLTYVATLYDAVGGNKIGIAKRSIVTRWGAPEVQFVWSPGECPLTPGQTYYIEVTAENSSNLPSTFSAYCNSWAMYPQGNAYFNRTLQAWNIDIAGTIMEEESAGSAAKPTVNMNPYPSVATSDRFPDRVTVRWTTDVPSDSTLEYAAWNCPYTNTYYDSTLTTTHAVTLTGLKGNTIYHYRAKSAASNYKTAVTRDLCTATTNDTPNLLANPGFEEGTPTTNPHKQMVTGWNCTGMDISEEDGTYCSTCSPGTYLNQASYAGTWSMVAAANGSDCNGKIYQTVDVTPGVEYNFTVAVSSWMLENDKWKYDVWSRIGRLDYMCIGIDPLGKNDPSSSTIKWSPRMYSHLRYTLVGTNAVAYANKMTVFVVFGGAGGQWHMYGVDDSRLSAIPTTVNSLADMKSNSADGLNAKLSDMVVTAVPSEAGAYYVESADRTQGIRVESADTIAAGDKVIVTGVLQTDPQTKERYLANATLTNEAASTEPEALFMGCTDIGGSALGVIPALSGTTGPHNTGLVVKIAGKVTVKDSAGAYIYVNDGGLEGNGIKVDTASILPSLVPDKDATVAISGISSILYDGTNRLPLVIARRASDISAY